VSYGFDRVLSAPTTTRPGTRSGRVACARRWRRSSRRSRRRSARTRLTSMLRSVVDHGTARRQDWNEQRTCSARVPRMSLSMASTQAAPRAPWAIRWP